MQIGRGVWIAGLMLAGACTDSRVASDLEAILAQRRAEEADASMDMGGDGDTDEATVESCQSDMLGRSCSAGDGSCARVGEWVCEDGAVVCDAVAAVPRTELCGDGKDQDCDGTVDEAPEGACCSDADCSEEEACDQVGPASPGMCMVEGSEGPCEDVDLMTDAANCGTCGNECGSEETCEAGACIPPMTPEPDAGMPVDDCGGADLMTDEDNCGTCGNECGTEETCEAGKCIPPMTPEPDAGMPIDDCGGADLMTDEDNCGTCGNECEPLWSCTEGACLPRPVQIRPISLASWHGCAVEADGTPNCWGVPADHIDFGHGQINVPPGRVRAVASASYFSCALDESGALSCWGNPPPLGTAIQASELATAGASVCVTSINGIARCWSQLSTRTITPPTSPVFGMVGGGNWGAGYGPFCALDVETEFPVCWGNDEGEAAAPSEPMLQLTAFRGRVCGIRKRDLRMQCWGDNQPVPTADQFNDLCVGREFVCGVLSASGEVKCWGTDKNGAIDDAPTGKVANLACTDSKACATRAGGELVCWGLDNGTYIDTGVVTKAPQGKRLLIP